jgi:hypothetical protein
VAEANLRRCIRKDNGAAVYQVYIRRRFSRIMNPRISVDKKLRDHPRQKNYGSY